MQKTLQAERSAPIGRIAYVLAAVAAALALAWVWQFVVRAPAVTYGDPVKTYFSKTEAAPGEEINLCFGGVEWHRLCPGELVTWLVPNTPGAKRIDLQTHRISTPVKAGPVEEKCRPWKVPTTAAPGQWTLSGHASAACAPFGNWYPVVTPLPAVRLTVTK